MKLKVYLLFILFPIGALTQNKQNPSQPTGKNNITLVIHGGAGTITRQNMTPEKEKAYKEALNKALVSGYAVLEKAEPAWMPWKQLLW